MTTDAIRQLAQKLVQESDAPTISIIKTDESKRYALMPLYGAFDPSRKDLHGHYTDPDEFQQEMWELVKNGHLHLHDSHSNDMTVGNVVESVMWPFPFEATLTTQPGGYQKKMTFPANTHFCGVQFTPEGWERFKNGDLNGLSWGGMADQEEEVDDS